MDSLDSHDSPGGSRHELREQYESLRYYLVSLFVLAIVISGTLNIYLLRQLKFVRRDLETFRPQAQQIIEEYRTNSSPMIDELLRRFAAYGREHADFAPIMTAYGLNQVSNLPPVTAPAPAVPGPAKQ